MGKFEVVASAIISVCVLVLFLSMLNNISKTRINTQKQLELLEKQKEDEKIKKQ